MQLPNSISPLGPADPPAIGGQGFFASLRMTDERYARIWDTPESAATWAESIRDAAKRNSAVNTVATSWLAVDPDGARTWILRSPSLSAEQKAGLLKNR